MNSDGLLSRQDQSAKKHLSESVEVLASASNCCDAILCPASRLAAEPLRPKQFYLDTALAYEAAIQLGEQETKLAERAGVHIRTLRWYRRIAGFPPECQDLIRLYPKLFHATWAVQMVRCGPSATFPDLLGRMQQMVTAGRTWVRKHAKPKAMRDKTARSAAMVENSVITGLKNRLNDPAAADLAIFVRRFLQLLVQGQLLDEAAHLKIVRSLWSENTNGVSGDAPNAAAAQSARSETRDARSS